MTRTPHRKLLAAIQIVLLSVVTSALYLGLRLWLSGESYDYYNPPTSQIREWQRVQLKTSAPEITVEASAPLKVRVGDEHTMSIAVQIEGLPPAARADVLIETSAPGLRVHPASLRKTTGGLTGGNFIISADSPGRKLLHVSVDVSIAGPDAFRVPTIEAPPLHVEVFEESDAVDRWTSVAQALGLPALIALVVSELLRRRSGLKSNRSNSTD